MLYDILDMYLKMNSRLVRQLLENPQTQQYQLDGTLVIPAIYDCCAFQIHTHFVSQRICISTCTTKPMQKKTNINRHSSYLI